MGSLCSSGSRAALRCRQEQILALFLGAVFWAKQPFLKGFQAFFANYGLVVDNLPLYRGNLHLEIQNLAEGTGFSEQVPTGA